MKEQRRTAQALALRVTRPRGPTPSQLEHGREGDGRTKESLTLIALVTSSSNYNGIRRRSFSVSARFVPTRDRKADQTRMNSLRGRVPLHKLDSVPLSLFPCIPRQALIACHTPVILNHSVTLYEKIVFVSRAHHRPLGRKLTSFFASSTGHSLS